MLTTGHACLVFEKVAKVTSVRTFPKKENINVHVEMALRAPQKKTYLSVKKKQTKDSFC